MLLLYVLPGTSWKIMGKCTEQNRGMVVAYVKQQQIGYYLDLDLDLGLLIESMTMVMVHLLLVAIFTLLFCIGASGVGVAATGTPSRREWRNLRGFQVQAAGHGRRRAQGAGFGGPGPQGCGFNQCYMPVSGILLLFYAYYKCFLLY